MLKTIRKDHFVLSIGVVLLGACGVKGRPLVPDVPPPIGRGIRQTIENEAFSPANAAEKEPAVLASPVPTPTLMPAPSKGSKTK